MHLHAEWQLHTQCGRYMCHSKLFCVFAHAMDTSLWTVLDPACTAKKVSQTHNEDSNLHPVSCSLWTVKGKLPEIVFTRSNIFNRNCIFAVGKRMIKKKNSERSLCDYLPKHYFYLLKVLTLILTSTCFGNLPHVLKLIFPVNPFSNTLLQIQLIFN